MQIEVSMKIVSIEYIEVKYQKQTSSLHVIVTTYHGTRLQRVGNSRTMHTHYAYNKLPINIRVFAIAEI